MSESIENQLKADLAIAKREIAVLKGHYEGKLTDLKDEVKYLREMIMAQNEMLQNAINHVQKLEKDMKNIKQKVKDGNFHSIH